MIPPEQTCGVISQNVHWGGDGAKHLLLRDHSKDFSLVFHRNTQSYERVNGDDRSVWGQKSPRKSQYFLLTKSQNDVQLFFLSFFLYSWVRQLHYICLKSLILSKPCILIRVAVDPEPVPKHWVQDRNITWTGLQSITHSHQCVRSHFPSMLLDGRMKPKNH